VPALLRRRAASRLAAVTLAGGLGWFTASSGVAWAHAQVVATFPSAETAPQRVTHVSVTFDETVELVPRALALTTDLGVPVALDRPRLTGGRELRANLQDSVGPGGYVVAWRVLADDGHVESGTFRFLLRGPAPGGAPAAVTPASPGGPADPLWPVLVAAGLAVAAGVGAAIVVRRGLRALSPGPLQPPTHDGVPSSDDHTTSSG
jgi:methionine-rich copper-binding protein CopC